MNLLKEEPIDFPYETVENEFLNDESEKEDVIDVLHLYPSKNDVEYSLKKNYKNIFISYLNSYYFEKIGLFIRSSIINMFLPFINGVFLGFGEIFAHEMAIRWNLLGARQRSHRLNRM